jgi:hypothetical protein
MLRRNRAAWVIVAALGVALAAPAADDEVARSLAVLKAVGREGKANDAAGPAWKDLVSQGGSALFPTLAAVDDANPTTANWLRTAAEAIAEAETKAGRPLPADKLEAFAKDTKFAPSARQLAYELLAAQDKTAPGRLLPGFLNDPSPDLRRDAIAAELDKIEKSARPSVRADLEKLFTYTRDRDQVDDIAKRLEKQGAKVSIAEHFAFITHWQLVGPFDSAQGKALTMSHPPETATDTAGKFKGKGGAEVGWKPYTTRDRYAAVDLNAVIGKQHDACAYALGIVFAEKEAPCEVRVASPNAVQIFLNGKKVFEREEYHHGANLDYHTGKGVLKAGENRVLVKVGQNNQTDSWAQAWQFQARVCDATGGPLPGVTQLAPDGKKVKLGQVPDAPAKEEKK